MELRCKHVVVTGGGSGIGKAIAKRLVDGGAKVIICGRTLEKLEQAKSEIGAVEVLQWDITDHQAFEEKLRQACELIGSVDGFVNAAAMGTGQVTGRGYEPWDITPEEWQKTTDIDYTAAFFMMRNEVDYLKKNGIRGNILNIASNAACMGILGTYGGAKTAVIRWTRAFGNRFGHDGIIINGIAPGATYTPMISYYAKEADQRYERHAIERFIRPEEIAELAAYLMSNFGEIICGHTVVADGGDNAATL